MTGEVAYIRENIRGKKWGRIRTQPGQGNKDMYYFMVEWAERSGYHNVKEGDKVSFEGEIDNQGRPRVKRFMSPGGDRQRTSVHGNRIEYFLNPYNFVRATFFANDKSVFGRKKYDSHKKFIQDRLNGWIECKLTTVTPFFIPDSRKEEENYRGTDGVYKSGHRRFGYFTYDKFTREDDLERWKEEGIDTTTPAIPGSSLRGMLRNIYETITGSCFSVFDGEVLDYRNTTEARNMCPARVVSLPDKNNHGILEIFSDKGVGLSERQALIGAYFPRAAYFNPSDSRNKLAPKSKHCERVYALIENSPTGRIRNRFSYSKCLNIKPHSGTTFSGLPKTPGATWKEAWLKRTGPNIENKHHERVFYHKMGKSKYALFSKDEMNRFNYILEGYYERFASKKDDIKKLKNRDNNMNAGNPPDKLPAPSLFVKIGGSRKLQKDDLIYVDVGRPFKPRNIPIIDQSGTKVPYSVEYQASKLALVAIPRLSYEHDRKTVLKRTDKKLLPCEDIRKLCPACRLFGWVKKEAGDEEREIAYKGRISISNATAKNWNPPGNRTNPVPLRTLNSPKPTTCEFYLFDNDRMEPRDGRPIGNYNDRNVRLRGRKHYRSHHQKDDYYINRGEKNKQNITADLVPKETEFTFKIHFDNLCPEELGALAFCLELKEGSYNRLGHGKPLGLGMVKIEIEKLKILERDDSGEIKHYKDLFYPDPIKTGDEAHSYLEHRTDFTRELTGSSDSTKAMSQFLNLTHIKELLYLLKEPSDKTPVIYPLNPENYKDDENFKWFMMNRKKPRYDGTGIDGKACRLPTPLQEAAGKKLPVRNFIRK